MEFKIGLVGHGEVGKIFASGLRIKTANWVGAWDTKFNDPALGPEERALASAQGVQPCDSVADLSSRATILMSAVTASNTLAVA